MQDLKDTRPRDWWCEVKQLCSNGRIALKDLRPILRIYMDCINHELANKINEAFVNVMRDYTPLSDEAFVLREDDEPIMVPTNCNQHADIQSKRCIQQIYSTLNRARN